MPPEPTLLGQGFHWQDLSPGQRFRTHRRTITEHDLMAFVTLAGMQEPLFVDATFVGPLNAVSPSAGPPDAAPMDAGPADARPIGARPTGARPRGARPVPGALTYALIEGMVLAGMAHGTGLALLDTRIQPRAPVRVGDTIAAEVEVTEVRAASAGGRGVVASAIRVTNQRGETVMDYTAVRLMSGRAMPADGGAA